jgi:hypothetical protein
VVARHCHPEENERRGSAFSLIINLHWNVILSEAKDLGYCPQVASVQKPASLRYNFPGGWFEDCKYFLGIDVLLYYDAPRRHISVVRVICIG